MLLHLRPPMKFLFWGLLLVVAHAAQAHAAASYVAGHRHIEAPVLQIAGLALPPRLLLLAAARDGQLANELSLAGYQALGSGAPVLTCTVGAQPPWSVEDVFAASQDESTPRGWFYLFRYRSPARDDAELPLWALMWVANRATGTLAIPDQAKSSRDDPAEVVALLASGETWRGQARSTSAAPNVPYLLVRRTEHELTQHLALSPQETPLSCTDDLLLPPPAPLAQSAAQSVVWHAATPGNRVALTFDACSTFSHGAYNPAVIAALTRLQVPATLFIGGRWAEMHPQELWTLAQNPLFEIGNHTYTHPHMRDLSPSQQRQELLWTQEAIYRVTGRVPRLFRPPYGEVDDGLIRTAADLGLVSVEYDLPAGDADYQVSEARLTHWVVGQSEPGSIVIMHMNRPGNHTATALPGIVAGLRARNLTLSMVGDLIELDGTIR